jgi:hypothetical protein
VLQFPVCLALTDDGSGLLALSAGVAASAVWWAFFSRYAETEGQRFLERQLSAQRGQLNDELDAHRALLVAELDDGARRWRNSSLPRDVYPAAHGFDLRFNRDLTNDLMRSREFFFCGRSGIYVPGRILMREELGDAGASPKLEEVRLRLIDPASDLAMGYAIRDRRGKISHRDKSDDELRGEIVENLFMTLIALWEARYCVTRSIRIWHESVAVFKRHEVFEHAVYDSSIDLRGREAFPPTVCWAAKQPAHTQLYEDFRRQDHADPSLVITPYTPEGVFSAHLDRLGFGGDVEEYLLRYRSEHLERLRSGLRKALAFDHVESFENLQGSEGAP